jgi:hypothetical protein
LGGMSDREGGRMPMGGCVVAIGTKRRQLLVENRTGQSTLLLDANHAVVRQGPVVVLARHREREGEKQRE